MTDLDRERLACALERAFESEEGERRAVVRAAGDLADSGRLAADRGEPLTVETVVSELADAPDGSSLAERWNWWVGALAVAYGDAYAQFGVRRHG
ncbi:hypothetical protein [Haloplanus vescus]|uniref:hypothetical protein n=1 Tax=Haloplanus vescus TaxID=555874 RepID=UPI000B88D745|nr:hypothetical protein [Haloplanus vescus]